MAVQRAEDVGRAEAHDVAARRLDLGRAAALDAILEVGDVETVLAPRAVALQAERETRDERRAESGGYSVQLLS